MTAAARLAAALEIAPPAPVEADHPALAWRRAGLMAITGRADGRGLVAPVALTALADGALALLKGMADARAMPQNGALLLGERARLMGLTRQGAVSPNGSCRLYEAVDGHIALNLPRAEDWEMAPALVGEELADRRALAAAIRHLPVDALVERGRLLGLGIAADRSVTPPARPFQVSRLGQARPPAARAPLVVDLSALWAGPLAGALLAQAGAQVVKVESVRRPDGARQGHAGFFHLLNGAKQSVALDFADPGDLAMLRRLIVAADIVIEASRPRALRNLGIDAEAQAARGATWISITAHGREGASGEAVGFGDDAAVAGGLSFAMRASWRAPLFAGDAIADPLTGIVAALAGWAGWRQGGGRLIALAMADVVAFAAGLGVAGMAASRAWQRLAEEDVAPFYPMREPAAPARPLGADTASVLQALASLSWPR